MFKFVWEIKEEDYKDVENPMEAEEDFDFIGLLRVGNICFDVMRYKTNIRFNMFVGGVESGYGTSDQKGYENYPYDYYDEGEFRIDAKDMSFNEFKDTVEKYIENELIKEDSNYLADGYKECTRVNLFDKANEEVKFW